ncbi:MAG TPA: helix-turn-helix transcriptional regulator [Spirochaetota bacterium]|nr:helix-turn-helix transcriptional regulator [Spirochaetota bacterium]
MPKLNSVKNIKQNQEKEIKKSIGLYLNQQRIKQGLTIKKLAERSSINNANTLWRILKGGRGCSFVTLFKIIRALNLDISSVFRIFDTDTKQPQLRDNEKKYESGKRDEELERIFYKLVSRRSLQAKKRQLIDLLRRLDKLLT